MANKIDFDPNIWKGTESDKKRFESMGFTEKQMQVANVLLNYPVIAPSTIKDREELLNKEISDGRTKTN